MSPRDFPRQLYGAQEGAFCAFWVAREVVPRGFTLLVTADEARAQESFFACECALGRGPVIPGNPASPPKVAWLPSPESCYLEVLSDPSVLHSRMSLLAQLHFGSLPRVLIASVTALTRKTLHRAVFDALCVLVGPGVRFPLAELGKRLVEAGYTRSEVVEDEGTFAQRGQVLDVFVPSLPSPARITYFDDEIEHVHLFDAQTQKRYLPLEELLIHPVREAVLGDPAGLRERLYQLADRSGFPSTKSRMILERIEAGEDFFGMEALVPLYHDRLVPIADYLPQATKVVYENPDALAFSHRQMLAEEGARHDARLADRLLAFPPEACLITGDDWGLGGFDAWRMHPGVSEDGDGVELDCRLHLPQPAHGEPLEPLRNLLRGHLDAWRSPVFLTVDDPKHSAIARILEESHFPLRVVPSEEPLLDRLEAGTVTLRRGHLRRGYDSFDLPPVITEEEFFGVKSRSGTAKKSKARAALASMEALVEGEPVVHQVHGVGLFRGLFRESPGGVAGDYLLLEYDGGDRLYLPVYRVSQLSPYRGGPTEKLKLDKLGGKTWTATKKKVSLRVRDLAEKLLQSATLRESRPPVAVSPDDPMVLSFSATFPYEETPDQERAIDEVLADLTGEKPMDRLICGDVGYGKTEVALRAAFAVVAGGKQVALLAPTTLLVEQHLRTFSERMSGFPVRVAALSRFTGPASQKETLAQVADGRVDILIGTHRLLSRDVHFARLGLLVVDEEQKFGVAQKEQFRFWKSGIDVLTLSATPIPRTLQLGLVGLREISLINTPPQERLAVRTFVAPLDRNVMREAILREHARGGQVFVVSPRVGAGTGAGGRVTHSVEQWAEMIQEWVPTVRLAVAHGQMDASRLERVMLDFLHGAVDVLVSTTIIESGLDISRANTLLVMDSHLFGLAQLYQLRGRVGRKNVRAYAYFFLPEKQAVTPEARRRLLALQRHTQLGSGFALASEDLEIRGAGEVLGAKQSGTMAQVGFETYLEIVRQVAAELRNEPLPVENDPELHLDVAAYFSEEYIPEPAERLIWYRRLALAPDPETMASLKEVLTDRYGAPEPEGELYFSMMELKILARAINAVGIGLLGNRLTVHLDRNTRLDPVKVTERMKQGLPFTFSGPQRLSAVLSGATGTPERLELAMNHLQTLLYCVT